MTVKPLKWKNRSQTQWGFDTGRYTAYLSQAEGVHGSYYIRNTELDKSKFVLRFSHDDFVDHTFKTLEAAQKSAFANHKNAIKKFMNKWLIIV